MRMDGTAARVGWIGTGRMGFELAARLAAGGCDLAVYNRTRAKAEPLSAHGAAVVDEIAGLADRDVVFSAVSASADLEHVAAALFGVADRAPALLVDCSTVSAESSARVRAAAAERGADFLAVAISGNPKVVRAGQLTLAASGPRPAFDRAEELLRLLGRSVTYVGEGELARLVKICHNVFLGVVIQALTEVAALAEKGGSSRAAFLHYINDSVLGSAFTRYKTPALVGLDFTPTFTMPLLHKDLGLGLSAGEELGVVMPVATRTAELVAEALEHGYQHEDFAALLVEQAKRSGMTLTAEQADVEDGLSAKTGE
jgi:3-hydroxyisobutyrate dehydrogenase-like beta-hydroxyacid dehydrogenase